MGYVADVEDVEDAISDALTDADDDLHIGPVESSSGRVFTSNRVEKKEEIPFNQDEWENLSFGHADGNPYEVPLDEGEPYGLMVGMEVDDDFDKEEFEDLISDVFLAGDYSLQTGTGRIGLFSSKDNHYRLTDGEGSHLSLFFFDGDDNNYLYNTRALEESYSDVLWDSKEIAAYLDDL